ncbi:hypothetical protein ACFORH_39240 [Amycolatopsis roodepoortensis]|uniref:Uncharacterized protein n=1 Tax=Amycolatopsis roodepoortensis TaxID=700274 RepID=A0ABR9LIR8_9PSEU|nr:hypothetical protein [Amycolatopsis roodepoortensis]MBE1580553.1 hypothetical protein [Amycolatopsis roodepoortensis]
MDESRSSQEQENDDLPVDEEIAHPHRLTVEAARVLQGIGVSAPKLSGFLVLNTVTPAQRVEYANLLRRAASLLDEHARTVEPKLEEEPGNSADSDNRPEPGSWVVDTSSTSDEHSSQPKDSPVQKSAGDPVE